MYALYVAVVRVKHLFLVTKAAPTVNKRDKFRTFAGKELKAVTGKQ
jgi:hypothetical protein